MWRAWLILAIIPAPALSEGAVQTFDCVTTAVCDEDGACAPSDDALGQPVTIRLEPVAIGPFGEGDYRISYSDMSAPMKNVTGLGPLLWSEGGSDSQTILITSETTLLWQRFDFPTGRSVVSFLTCGVTQ